MKRLLILLMLVAVMLAPVIREVTRAAQASSSQESSNAPRTPEPADRKDDDEQPAQQEGVALNSQKPDPSPSLEEKKLELEKEKLAVERSKIPWTAFATIAPLIGVLFTVAYSAWSFRKQSQQQMAQRDEDAKRVERQRMADAKLQFELKAAEIAFAGDTPLAVQHRAGALKAMFGERLPEDFLSSYDPYKFGEKIGNIDSRKFLLELLIQHPDKQLEIVLFWKQLFPGDVGWLSRLNNLSPGRIQVNRETGEGQSTNQSDTAIHTAPAGTPNVDTSPSAEDGNKSSPEHNSTISSHVDTDTNVS
jgi:hypothetical protein